MEIFKKSVFGLIFLSVISYLFYLMFSWTVIVKEDFLDKNKILIGLYILIFLYYLIFYVIKPTYIKRFKLRNTLIWVFVILSSQYFFLNEWHNLLYYADIFTVIWLFLTIIWPTNLLVSKKLKQEVQEKKMEIIEV
jgi:hypothetical protein